MKKTIVHDGIEYDIEEVKSDFQKIFDYVDYLMVKEEIALTDHRRRYTLLKFLFSGVVKRGNYTGKIYDIVDLCQKYSPVSEMEENKTIYRMPNESIQSYNYRCEHNKRFREKVRNETLKHVDDLIIACENPFWSYTFGTFVKGSNFEAHKKIMQTAVKKRAEAKKNAKAAAIAAKTNQKTDNGPNIEA